MSGIIGTSHSKSKVIGRSKDTAKVWVRYDQANNSVLDSFNVSSVTDESTAGMFTTNFINPMLNDDYCVVGMSQDNSCMTTVNGNVTTTSVKVYNIHTSNNNSYDRAFNCVLVFGD